MKKRPFPPLTAVFLLAAALIAAPFLLGIPSSAAQSDDGMVDVYDPSDPDAADTPVEEPEPWEAEEITGEWNDETAPENPPLEEEAAEDDWTDLYPDIYDDPEGIYEGIAEPTGEDADWESEESAYEDQPYDDEPADTYDDAVQPYE